MFGFDTPVDDFVNTRDYMKSIANDINTSIESGTSALGGKYNISGNLANVISSTLPSFAMSAALTYATGGLAAPSTLGTSTNVVLNLLKNPIFYTSFVSIFGDKYYGLVDQGVNPLLMPRVITVSSFSASTVSRLYAKLQRSGPQASV